MKSENSRLIRLFGRYFFIIVLGVNDFYMLRKLLRMPTVKTLSLIASELLGLTVNNGFIHVNDATAAYVAPQCLLTPAFFMLAVLVFSTPQINHTKRLAALSMAFTALFILNIARMTFLIFIIEKPYFDTVHFLLQNVLSIPLVVGIWILITILFKIKTIPVYSDIKYLYSLTKHR